MPEYSKRLGVISHGQFRAALDRFDLGSLLRAEPVPFGNFGQNVFLTSTSGQYVLRGSPHDVHQFPRERFFTRLLHEHTPAPVPWPYHLDLSDDIFGWSYVIMPRMPGVQLIDPQVRTRLTAKDRHGIAHAMGETLACLHTLTWPHAGQYDVATDTVPPLGEDFGEWLISRIRHFLQLAIPHSDRTTPADIEWVEDLIAAGREALAIPFQPCFVLEDYKEGNTVAERKGGAWHITGVFDYQCAYFGDGEADLSRSVASFSAEDNDLARAFLQAYMNQAADGGRPLRTGFTTRFPLYMLLDRLIIWQFAQQHGVWIDASLTLREWASPYTSLSVV